jgi:cytochrome c oxidase assembly factor CtaG
MTEPFEPWVAACLASSAFLYSVGLARLWRRAGVGRGVRAWEVVAFVLGWFALALALCNPLDKLADALFSAHMVEHELLMVVAAPLLVLGRPLGAWVWAFPQRARSSMGRALHRPAWRVPWMAVTTPLAAWTMHAAALWLWHLPAAFDAALESEGLHVLQHLSFFGTALLYWWSVLGGAARHERGAALLSLFTTLVHTGALGALFTLSAVAWYPAYSASTGAWGMTPLEDQQLGGIIMWVPASVAYIACGLAIVGRMLGSDPAPVLKAEQSAITVGSGSSGSH